MKQELLRMLRDEMMDESKEEKMRMLPEGKMKATIVAEDEEGLIEGAKKLLEALSQAEKFMKMRLGKDKK